MNTFDFKIRLAMYPDREVPILYVDELPENVRISIISRLSGEYDWLDRTDGESKGSEEYVIQQKIMAQDGFTNDDIDMIAKYKSDGKLHISIITDKDFNELREVRPYFGEPFKRTLLDCVKDCINGHLSDGIGENEVGRYCYGGINYDIWLSELETDAETDDKRYFKVKDRQY